MPISARLCECLGPAEASLLVLPAITLSSSPSSSFFHPVPPSGWVPGPPGVRIKGRDLWLRGDECAESRCGAGAILGSTRGRFRGSSVRFFPPWSFLRESEARQPRGRVD